MGSRVLALLPLGRVYVRVFMVPGNVLVQCLGLLAVHARVSCVPNFIHAVCVHGVGRTVWMTAKHGEWLVRLVGYVVCETCSSSAGVA